MFATDSELPAAKHKRSLLLNPSAAKFRSWSAPAAPARKIFAGVFSDLPKDAPPSPGPLQLKTGNKEFCNIDGQLLPRPTPIKFRFSLVTNS